VFPAASAFSGTQEREQLNELYLRGMKLAAAVGAFPAIALAAFSRPFLLLWLGPEYAGEGATVLSILAIGFLLNSLTQVPFQVLQSTRHVDVTSKASMGYAALNLGLFAVLIPSLGIRGAAIAFAASQVLFVPWFIGKANRLLDVGWPVVLRTSYTQVFFATALSTVVCWLVRPWVHTFLTLTVAVALSGVVYLTAVLTLVLEGKERAALLLVMQRGLSLLPRRAAPETI